MHHDMHIFRSGNLARMETSIKLEESARAGCVRAVSTIRYGVCFSGFDSGNRQERKEEQ